MNPELRALPSVDELLRELPALEHVGPQVARWIVRREVEAARARILAGSSAGDVRALIAAAADALTTRRVRRVINATGVVLHTNLGRAQLSDEAKAAVLDAMGAAAIEYDVEAGARAARAPVASALVAALTDAEDALVVNNNAAALLLALTALAHGREVIVGRGELIEIGGEFRLPDVMAAGGAHLREVGTTNRTRAGDYADALTERTAMILKVHPSNFRVTGFTSEASIAELAEIARGANVVLMHDVGSGLITPRDGMFHDESDAASSLAGGADLVCFSGDKLLGGPQAGVLAGPADLVERCRRHPVARAVRADKLTLAALEATLWAYARGDEAKIPTWRMLDEPAERIEARVQAIAQALPRGAAEIVPGESVIGGGSVPGSSLPSALLRIASERPEALAAALRRSDPPVIARVERGAVVLDLRTVDPGDDAVVASAITTASGGPSPPGAPRPPR